MKAVLFGSVGAVSDTSERQRAAFNRAFDENGLDWQWHQSEYRRMLRTSGGKDRIEAYARARGEAVDAAAIHKTKSALFQADLATNGVELRRGVVQLLCDASATGVSTGFVTTTEAATVSVIGSALDKAGCAPFDVVTDRTNGFRNKPSGDVYRHALRILGIDAADAIAVEDNKGGVAAAKDAGLFTIGFPGENTAADDLSDAHVIAHSDIYLSARDMVLGSLRMAI